ncbi:MAG: hypothetical protein ABIU63_14975 [Chitinophagaceae bacterium]
MKLSSAFIAVAAAVVTVFFATACSKIYDYVKQHPGAEVKSCRVKSVNIGIDTVFIYYNAAGDPTDMIRNLQNSGWQGDRHFRYDENHRLKDYYWANEGVNYRLIWHRYSYPNKTTVIDSSFTYIEDGSGPNPPIKNLHSVSVDSLDAEGRIVKITYPDMPLSVEYFTYNTKGNLDLPNAHYDNKLSIYRTNRVWMFLMNNYSASNLLSRSGLTLAISNYNVAGLPLDFAATFNNTDILFVTLNGKLQVNYDCN